MITLNFPNPVTTDEGFFDRHAEWKIIESAFRARERKPVIILGERRIGKTSLQSVAAKRLASDESLHFVPLFLPFGPHMGSIEDFARELLQGLCISAGKNIRETGLFTTDKGFRFESMGEYTQALRSIMSQTGEKDFLVCVDEFDETLRNCDAKDPGKLAALVTHLIEEGLRTNLPIRFLFSMTGVPTAIQRSFGSGFVLNNASLVELGPFSRADTVEMISTLLAPAAQTSEEALMRLYDLSGGHPYFIKLLLDCLLASFGFEAESLIVDMATVEQAAAKATDDPRPREVLTNIYDIHFDDEQKGLMLLLAERQAGATKKELKVIGPNYITAAESLTRRGYLEKVLDEKDPEATRYRLHIAFLGQWLQQWEKYESEVEKRLKDIRRRLQGMENPWEGVEPTIVTEEDLIEFGLHP